MVLFNVYRRRPLVLKLSNCLVKSNHCLYTAGIYMTNDLWTRYSVWWFIWPNVCQIHCSKLQDTSGKEILLKFPVQPRVCRVFSEHNSIWPHSEPPLRLSTENSILSVGVYTPRVHFWRSATNLKGSFTPLRRVALRRGAARRGALWVCLIVNYERSQLDECVWLVRLHGVKEPERSLWWVGCWSPSRDQAWLHWHCHDGTMSSCDVA